MLLRRAARAALVLCALAPAAFAAPGDLDEDGILDADEQDDDSDGDGWPDAEDPDDDGDEVPTRDEDADGDGDPRDDDWDGDGRADYLDPWVPKDRDHDGFLAEDWGGPDCDDEDANTNPDAFDQLYDGIDRDCDGASDYDGDGDGHDNWFEGGGDDCDDTNPDVHPGAEEDPGVGDVDCDGWSDSEHGLVANGGCDCGSARLPAGALAVALALLAARGRRR